ncbi:MAG TPA: prephenate dehydratase [Dehalococcoidia bacterium]|nr:prephenate dehydratase [Dehalococcoidia bacterium]
MFSVAFQGEKGAYSEDAVIAFFGDVAMVPYRYFSDVFDAVQRGKADAGVVPVENSQAGSVTDTYDLLLRYPLTIYGEVTLRVRHCLMALPCEKIETIKTVLSHPQGLAQSEEFLKKLTNIKIISETNTAASAKRIREENLKGYAAIASRRAALLYGLEILAEGIETNSNNYTRFFVISKDTAPKGLDNKTSLVFAVKNEPGSLYSILGSFARRNVNLTKLESRPSRDKPWEYVFYADFEGHIDDPVSREILEELKGKTSFLKILGSYPKAKI